MLILAFIKRIPMTSALTLETNEAAILNRVIKPGENTLSPAGARAILKLDFEESDRERMHELAVKNQEGKLTAQEQAELQGYLHVGLLLDLMRSKARLSLKRAAHR
jgi:hypothetical protein